MNWKVARAREFSLIHCPDQSGVHPNSNTKDSWGSVLVVQQPGYEDNHSPTPYAKVRNLWNYTSTPLYVYMAWCLIKPVMTSRLASNKMVRGQIYFSL